MTPTNISYDQYRNKAHQARSDFLAQAFADLCRRVRQTLAGDIGRIKIKA
ncbi:MAG: hypothetical protein QGI13_06000 [Rhodospirillales bacterium]|jgi:hypothetical protein|nr:hypothetical protein [Rhodospirillales bacterium]